MGRPWSREELCPECKRAAVGVEETWEPQQRAALYPFPPPESDTDPAGECVPVASLGRAVEGARRQEEEGEQVAGAAGHS